MRVVYLLSRPSFGVYYVCAMAGYHICASVREHECNSMFEYIPEEYREFHSLNAPTQAVKYEKTRQPEVPIIYFCLTAPRPKGK